MCPVCGTPLELATEAPQAERERALIERLVDDCAIQGAGQGPPGGRVRRRGAGRCPDDDGFDLAAYLVPGLAILLAAGGVGAAALGWRRVTRRDGAAPDSAPASGAGRRAPPVRPRPVRPVIAADGVDTTVVAAFAVGFISFISPCVLPLVPGYLSTISGVSFADIQAGKGRSKVLGPAILFCLSFTVMFVALGMTATGLRLGAARTTAGCCSRSPGVVLIAARAAVHRHAVREPAEPRVAPGGAAGARVDRRPDRGRPGVRGRLAAVHRPHPRRHPHRRQHRGQRRRGRRAAGLLRARAWRCRSSSARWRSRRCRASSASSATTTRRSRWSSGVVLVVMGVLLYTQRADAAELRGAGADGRPGDQLLQRALTLRNGTTVLRKRLRDGVATSGSRWLWLLVRVDPVGLDPRARARSRLAPSGARGRWSGRSGTRTADV